MIPDEQISQVALQKGMPPSLLRSLLAQPIPDHLKNPEIQGDVSEANYIAGVVSGLFGKHGDWKSALSAYKTADPNAHHSPTSDIGGWVDGILGVAAAHAKMGMEGKASIPYQQASDFANVVQEFADMGGVVTKEHLDLWSRIAGEGAPKAQNPQGEMTSQQPPRKPSIPLDKVVEFRKQAKSAGINDPNHIINLAPKVRALRSRLMGTTTSLADLVPHIGQTPDQMQQAIRAMPSPFAQDVSSGDFMDAWNGAQLHSMNYHRRMPTIKEAASFAAAGMDHRDMEDYYKKLPKQGESNASGQ